MLKNFGYDGVYRDQCISVSVLLENPANYGLDADYLTFAVSVRKTVNHTLSVRMEDFSFYLMDEQNQIYNMQKTPDSQPDNTMFSHDNNEPVYRINSLIFAEFKSEFLFQNLRIAFYYKKDQCLHIIELTH